MPWDQQERKKGNMQADGMQETITRSLHARCTKRAAKKTKDRHFDISGTAGPPRSGARISGAPPLASSCHGRRNGTCISIINTN